MIDSLITLIYSFINFILSNDVHIIKRLGKKYGRGMVKEVRKLENFIKKLIKTKCDEEFLRICLIYHLIPNFVRFKLWNTRYMKHNIYYQHQRKYLQLEYYQKSRHSLKQQLELEVLLKSMKNKINAIEYELLNKHFNKLKQNKKAEIRLTHKTKIEKLSKGDVKLDSINSKKVVYNISSRPLTDDEESILSKGLQFCIETKIKNTIEFKTEIEMMAFSILKQLYKPDETSLNSCLTECIHRAADQSLKINKNKKIINVNKNELIALKSLLKDQNIVIMKADKGSACVIMDKEHYKSKVGELLSTGTSFKKIDDFDERGKANTIEHVVKKMENKLDHRLNELKKAKKLSQDDYDYVRCTGSRCSVLFCNPKVHKEGMPLRPIISTANSYNYKLAKFLTKLVEDARPKPKSYVKDSFSFARLIQLQKPVANDVMISLDVESLFTNVPVYEAIELAIKIITDKKKIDKNYTKLTAKDLRNLFQLAVTNTPFRFYNKLYMQIDGVSMGSPLAPILADVFMTYIEQRIDEYEHSDKIKLYLRYVDDTFIIFNGKENDAQQLVEFVNKLHTKLKFTYEIENNFESPFLDVKVIKQRTKFETTVFRKKTHTGQLLHWQSCQAKKYKIGLIKTLTFRALSICSSKQLLEEQCELIETTMIHNGYPVNLVRRKIKNTIEQYQKNASTTKNKSKIGKQLFIPLTYYGDETIIMSNKIKDMIKSLFPTIEVIFGYKKGLTLGKLFTKNFKGKDPMEIGVIYKLTCSACDQVYIGQTKLNVNERMKQHKEGLYKPETSRAADHMINNKNHVIEFSKPEIIGRDIHRKRREIKETFLSLQHQHSYNKISHELMIFTN
jgi:predicted GIY-YIG superfamily endonuclease